MVVDKKEESLPEFSYLGRAEARMRGHRCDTDTGRSAFRMWNHRFDFLPVLVFTLRSSRARRPVLLEPAAVVFYYFLGSHRYGGLSRPRQRLITQDSRRASLLAPVLSSDYIVSISDLFLGFGLFLSESTSAPLSCSRRSPSNNVAFTGALNQPNSFLAH